MANDQLVVVDRGAHQVHCTVIVWKILDLRCFFCKLRHIKTTTEMCDLVGHRCVFRCVFVVGEFSDIPNGHQVYWPSPLCLSASTWIPFALVRLELLPHVGNDMHSVWIQYRTVTTTYNSPAFHPSCVWLMSHCAHQVYFPYLCLQICWFVAIPKENWPSLPKLLGWHWNCLKFAVQVRVLSLDGEDLLTFGQGGGIQKWKKQNWITSKQPQRQ